MASGSSGRFAEWLSVLMRSENLDELPESPKDANRTSVLSKILKSESLPYDEAVSGGRQGSPRSSGIFASETLPTDERPEPRGGRTPFIASLFSRETLPVDPAAGPAPAGRSPGR